ncbi:LLM class F420-dependent oxidoreductase [Plantactinospora sp. S1510]|uniref:LLM class F420-dependent oxidoreductase n=1 Tax=Plantactinospora alkalitolerans TaxID=2789879 RepID=A0ABS0H0G3_9ACTN|nr:LLM class F420-dependent oxidoreductase [Plantactinospora alkalitolerans]MBF9131958.1 LLM class F420-dependent oxidoreductase [Plantactinospora alkalitolerans]
MQLGSTGIWSIELRMADPYEIGDAAAELDELGWGTLWIPGLGGGDILGDSERLLRATRTAKVAVGVASIWRHQAAEIAAGHARLQDAHGHRHLLGLGVSDPAAAQHAGQPYRPLAEMGSYLDTLDQAPAPVPPGERLLAALGLLRPFLGMDHYARSLRRQGFAEEELTYGGSDRLVDSIVAWGDLETIGARVQAHHQAGADHVCLHVVGAGPGMPLPQWRELAPLTT